MRSLCLLLALVACDDATDRDDPFVDPRPARDRPEAGVPPAPEATDCPDLSCLPCGRGVACAPAPHIEGTCCAPGDPLEKLAAEHASEVVDVQTDGRLVFLCGGFGANIYDLGDPSSPAFVGHATDRCQHAAAGPMVGDDRVVFFAHHGDSWVGRPELSTYLVGPEGTKRIDQKVDPSVLFEGMAYANGYLYVAAHQGGLRVYAVSDRGLPDHRATLPELGNAWKVEVDGDVAYVVDNDFGVHVVSVAEPETPTLLGSIPTTGQPRDLAIGDGRLYVALGTLGVDIFDATDPVAPTPLAHVDTLGSAQSITANADWFAVAAWTHVAVYDAETYQRIATQRTRHRDQFEQDFAVELMGEHLIVGEWEAMHVFRYKPGRVSPDLWLDEDLFAFEGGQADARAVVIRNQGYLPLQVELTTDSPALSVEPKRLTIGPLDAAVAELTFTPPGTPSARLTLTGNDPDEPRADVVVDITDSSDRLDVGDPLNEGFAFLDPTGANQLEGLRGQVTILAYFALF